jgi:hypothetical protein
VVQKHSHENQADNGEENLRPLLGQPVSSPAFLLPRTPAEFLFRIQRRPGSVERNVSNLAQRDFPKVSFWTPLQMRKVVHETCISVICHSFSGSPPDDGGLLV